MQEATHLIITMLHKKGIKNKKYIRNGFSFPMGFINLFG